MIQVVNKLHYWASMYDYIKFDPELENPNGVKSVTVNQKIDSEWVEVASKEGEDLFNSEGNLLSSLKWPYKTFDWNKDFQIKSIYEDAEGNTHESFSYYSKPTDGSWKVNSSYDIDSYESYLIDIDDKTKPETPPTQELPEPEIPDSETELEKNQPTPVKSIYHK